MPLFLPMFSAPKSPRYLDLDLRPFAGHYVALVNGRIVAVADSAEAAQARATAARPQRPATILRIAHSDEPPAA